PVSDAVYFSSTTDQSDMVMTLNDEKYILEPVFMQANYIGVKLTDSAKQYLNVSNLVHKNALNDEMKHSLETNGLEYVLKTDIQKNDKDANAYSLNTGVVYTMEAKSKDDRYRPVFRASAKEALKVVGNSFDYIVNSAVDKNIITIDAEAIPLGNASTFAVSGYAVMPYSSVRSSGVEMGSSGVSGVMLYANGEYMTSADNKTMLSRLSATSDGSGFFKLNGIKGYDNDTVSIKIDDGNSQSVQYITLNSTGLAEKDISYTKLVKDESGKYIDTPVIEHGYELNLGNVELPVRTGYVPYVSSITYTVDPIKDFDYDTRNNEIAILATYANITANVVTNGRNV
ncbi:MAG: hypothetical protein IJ736_03415, partial [Firmicutes bacterium]|nr:hypothetical protein [Bacillota bacterium]